MNNNHQRMQRGFRGPAPRRAGFTLMEVALSLVVVGVGLLTVFGLFPTGLAMNKRATDDTFTTMFADEVLNAVKAAAADVEWSELYQQFEGQGLVPRHTQDWEDTDRIRSTRAWPQDWTTITLTSTDTVDFGNTYRFKLQIDDVGAGVERKFVRIEVAADEAGPPGRSVVMYTEILNTRSAQ